MKRLFIICLVLLLCASSLAVKIHSNETTKLGAFTGPVGASEQNDNVKASLDLAHTDLDQIIQELGRVGLSTGEVYYVDSGATGTDDAQSWVNASTTVDAAIVLAGAASLADTSTLILIAAEHRETLSSVNQVDVDFSAFTLWGLGNGENRPTFTHTTNGELVIGADDVAIHNLNFVAGNGVVHAIEVEAGFENYVINNCRFWTTSVNTDEFIDCIDILAGSDNGKITNCEFEIGAAQAVSAISHIGSDFTEISGNLFSGDFSTACIEDATTTSLWMIIKDNILINGDTAGGLNAVAAISLKAETSAIIVDNKIFCDMTDAGSIVAAAGYEMDNSYNGTIGSGTLLEIGKSYTLSMTSTFIDDTLFTVANGPILITSLVGEITTVSQTQANDIEIQLDADNGFDFDFSTAVEITGDLDGDRYTFDNTATESVLTPCTGADGGSAGTMVHWYCPPGLILINSVQASHSGNILWYMTFTPLAEGVTVTPG